MPGRVGREFCEALCGRNTSVPSPPSGLSCGPGWVPPRRLERCWGVTGLQNPDWFGEERGNGLEKKPQRGKKRDEKRQLYNVRTNNPRWHLLSYHNTTLILQLHMEYRLGVYRDFHRDENNSVRCEVHRLHLRMRATQQLRALERSAHTLSVLSRSPVYDPCDEAQQRGLGIACFRVIFHRRGAHQSLATLGHSVRLRPAYLWRAFYYGFEITRVKSATNK